MRRRHLLQASAGLAASLAAPSLAGAQSARVLKFVPQADLAILDPVWTTAYVSRNHGYMIFDTLFGQDGSYKASPQMVEGAVAEQDGRVWRLTLRAGLKFHDNTPVLARDCVASIRRWGQRDAFGQVLMASTDELSAADDRTIVFRLKAPFPLLPDALGKTPSYMAPMMPERLARTDAATQLTEMVGSGPYRFKADERVPGSFVAYERFAGYVPREGGIASWTAGPKIAKFDRVEWHVIPDAATAAAALQSGEVDWWEFPTADLLPLLGRDRKIKVTLQDPTGLVATLRLNHLQPPFDNPAIRRALLGIIDQKDAVTAIGGTDPAMTHTPVGFFCPGSPMASDAGLDVLTSPRDPAKVRQAILDAGYKGEKVVFIAPSDVPFNKALSDVAVDQMQKAGLNVDYVMNDWGTLLQRRVNRGPVDKGGWSAYASGWSGLDEFNPAVHLLLRAQGADGFIGWPNSPKLEALRAAWFAAPNLAAQQDVARQMQLQAFTDLPYVPMGQVMQPTAFSTTLADVPDGFAMFWGVRRT